MMKTLFSSLVIFALMISSSFAQGGPAGPPGNPVGSATFVQSGASPESVGGGVAVLINATDPTNDPITAVYYTVTGGAYLNQVFGQNYITCENIPLTSNFYLYPFPVASGGCGWFWDHNPGNKSVDIVVILQSGTTVTKHYDYVVTKPVVTELKISGPRTQLTFENNNSQFKAGFHKNGAVTIHAKVNGVGTPGTIGFTQRVDLSDMFTQKNGQWLRTNLTPPLADYPLPGPGYWSNANEQTFFANLNNQFVQMSDGPNMHAPIFLNNYPKKIEMSWGFQTRLTFRPVGGVLVGLGTINWPLVYSVEYTGPANPTIEQYTDPANWTTHANGRPAPWSEDGTIESIEIWWEGNISQIPTYQEEGQN